MLDSLHKTVQYILNNPGKALTLGLTGQVLGSSALNNFQNPSSVRDANLTWLNQTDMNPMELVPEAWLNANDTFLNKNLHRTKRDNPHDLELAKQDAIEGCITAIRSGDLMQAKESWRNIMVLDPGAPTLRKIIRDAYGGNLCNFDKVDNFIIYVIGSAGSKLIAYGKLMAEIRKNNQLFTSETLRLAYRFDQIMDYPSLNRTPEIDSLCESVKSKLPQAVNYLLHKRVCLRSVAQNNEYLYASWLKRPNKMDKHVFTWIPSEYAGEEAVWRFESSDNGKTFYIYNLKQHAYLHAIPDKYSDDRRNVIVQVAQGTLGKWRVQLVATESEIILWNDFHDETLYTADFKYNDNRRYVFTWLKGPVLSASARWKVEDCDFHIRQRRDISENGLENTDNNASLTLPDKPIANLLFFPVKQQLNRNNKTLEESIPSRLNSTVS